jgi:hypothetical protein
MPLRDLTGQRFGRLTVIERAGSYKAPNGNTEPIWRCKCDCGEVVDILKGNLLRGHTRSCGCLRIEIVKQNNKKRRARNGKDDIY